MTVGQIRFLSLLNILKIHDRSLERFGGGYGIRDNGLLSSAVDMPQSSYDGEYLHDGLSEMAAAYLYHICKNHAFVDGNKRTAAFSTLLFLRINGVSDDDLPDEYTLEDVTLKVANNKMTKPGVASFIRSCIAK